MQTPAICDKIPPFPAPRRKRARNRAPHHRGKRAAPSAARAVTAAARSPSLRSLGQSPTARPRYPAQTKVKTRSAPFAPHREVWRAAALQRNPAPACRSKAPSRKTPTGRLWRARRPSELQSYRPALSGRSNVAEGANRARRSFHSLANIGVLRAGRAQPLYLLTPSGRFAAFGGKCPLGTRFLPVHLRVALGLRPNSPQG